jgi:hypothetical protein
VWIYIAPLSEQMSRSRALYNKGKRWDFTFDRKVPRVSVLRMCMGRPFHKNFKWFLYSRIVPGWPDDLKWSLIGAQCTNVEIMWPGKILASPLKSTWTVDTWNFRQVSI